MRVLSRKKLNDFAAVYSDSESGLKSWWALMKKGDFANPSELRGIFASASFVGGETTVFNISGNKYRLVANVVYEMRTIFVEGVYTHEEYDRLVAAGLLRGK